MTILDDKLLPGVKKILLKVGDAATLEDASDPDGSDYDPTTGDVTFTPTPYSVLITPPSPQTDKYPDGDIGRTRNLVTILSKLLLTEGSVPDPLKGWKLISGTKTYQVLEVEDIKGAWQLTVK